MIKDSFRVKQISDIIFKNLATIIQAKVRDPRLQSFVITKVDVSRDIKNARVYYILGESADKKEAKKALSKARLYLQTMLSQTTNLKYTPKLRFIYDVADEKCRRLDSILQSL